MHRSSLLYSTLVGLFGLLLGSTLGGCGSSSSTSGITKSVIQGTVTTIPTSPTSTQTSPIAGCVILVEDSTGQVVARSTTDSSGHYQVSVVPGTYTILPQPVSSTLTPITTQQQITVAYNQTAVENFSYYNPSTA